MGRVGRRGERMSVDHVWRSLLLCLLVLLCACLGVPRQTGASPGHCFRRIGVPHLLPVRHNKRKTEHGPHAPGGPR